MCIHEELGCFTMCIYEELSCFTILTNVETLGRDKPKAELDYLNKDGELMKQYHTFKAKSHYFLKYNLLSCA
ncbi:hypothetical protein DPMN_079368 [Dreissena polymorpha]|uniref:Uncharacterized protein n=1 Tax=Dreissena polymorpha TaxID=45954 RepID=A0A9D4BSX7_DREPO|nr:hypothetical protein DPMN_079368 [Dreissena polymorpha]